MVGTSAPPSSRTPVLFFRLGAEMWRAGEVGHSISSHRRTFSGRMQTTVTILPLLVALAAAAPFELPIMAPTIPGLGHLAELANGTGIKWPNVIYFPDDNGEPVAAEVYGNATMRPAQESDVFFNLYTRRGPTDGEIISPGDVDSLRNSHFNASEPTIFVTHGFVQSIQADDLQNIKDMYVAYVGGNVIAVDWSKISKNNFYFIASKQAREVGHFIGAFTAFLVREAGLNVKHLHLVGHSLGAHVVGFAGKSIHLTVGQKAGRITGLDPAGPLFSVVHKSRRLDKEDADFVDVIHTCGGWLGMSAAIGHADYYPNGGTMRQPGCSLDFVTAGLCSHRRSCVLFAESINSRGFSSRHCSSYQDYLHDNCDDGQRSIMGHHAHKSASGTYYLATAKHSPYALG